MALVLEVADDIYQIEPENLGYGIPCMGYLVIGDRIALIETGSSSQANELLAGMSKLGHDVDSLSYIIPTHIHADHGGGAGYLAQQMPQAQVVVHRRGESHLVNPARLIEATQKAFGLDFEKYFGPILPVPEPQIWAVDDRETISLGERDLEIIHSPGHAPHHVSIYDTKTRGLFCGEALGCYLPADDVLELAIAPPIFELDLALDSIARLRELDPAQLFFSQWGVSDEVPRLFALAEEYIRSWGDIILDAMKAGDTEDEIIRKVQPCLWHSEYVKSEFLQHTLRSFLVAPYMAYFRREDLV